MQLVRLSSLAFALLAGLSAAAGAQSIDLTVHNDGFAIGDKATMNGLRINYCDERLVRINGINVTLWTPHDPANGFVNGLALGIPATGAKRINGAALGVLGVGAAQSINGIGFGAIGVGSGQELRGIMLGGIGVGSGGLVSGLSIGGVGVASGGAIRGIQIASVGVGAGGSVAGISLAGVGVASGGNLSGLAVAGVGVGAGGNFHGIGIAGLGVGSGGGLTGLMIGGIGVGSGGTISGVSIGGIGVGAPTINGLAASAISVAAHELHAIVIAPVYFKVIQGTGSEGGTFEGGALSAVSYVQGTQRGLTIGLFNYARDLHGAQLGLINVSDNGGKRRVLPIISVR